MYRWIKNCIVLMALLMVNGGFVKASILDTDFYCRTYGCVMISDGFGSDIYDVFRFAGGGTVPVGSPLISWTGNPIQGVGPVNIIETGTTTPIPNSLPAASNGSKLAIDSNGNGLGDTAINDNNNNGYLDAADSLATFSLNNSTDVVYQDNTLSRSFYLTSRNTRFELRARSSIDSTSSEYGSAVSLSEIPFSVSITQSGTDAGVSYGSLARNGNFSVVAGVNDLSDISAGYASIALFTHSRGIRRSADNANNHVYRQSLRFNMNYGYPALDLSRGVGSIQFRVEYAPYKR
ncbi:MAG: hypothetical protein V3V22_07290 [Methylococcales bacterium]